MTTAPQAPAVETRAPAVANPADANPAGATGAVGAPTPRTVMVLGEEDAALRHLVTRWALVHPDRDRDRLVAVHFGKTPAKLPPGVVTIAVAGGGAILDGARRAGRAKRLLDALRSLPAGRSALQDVDTLVVPDAIVDDARALADGRTVQAWSAFAAHLRADHLAALLTASAAGPSQGTGTAVLVADAVDALADTGADPSGIAAAAARALSRLLRAGDTEVVASVADSVRALPHATRDRVGLDAMLRIAEISMGGPADPAADAAAAAACFAAAEQRTVDGDVSDVPMLVTAGLRLIFHGDLHSDGPHSPLIDDPVGQLAPWRQSAFAARLRPKPPAADADPADPAQPADPADPAQTADPADPAQPAARPKIVVLGGAFGAFYQPIVDLLREAGHHPTVITPDRLGVAFTRHNLTDAVVGAWLRRVDPQLFGDLPLDPGVASAIAALETAISGADVVFADWCDAEAAFASWLLPPHARLVVRVHRVDAVRAWHQLVNWPRVAALMFVSDHVKSVVERQLTDPGSPSPVPMTVLRNVIDVHRYQRPKTPGAHRRIALVGWGRRVKDPIFALDVLADLVAEDDTWQLHLIGRDFAAATSPVLADYIRSFRERALDPAIRDNIRWVGFTGRLEEALDECGYALSTSNVEGWPVGVTEAAASGCIPVIRDWPQVAALGGAREIYRDHLDWVVATPAEAAARIRAAADPDAWAAASAAARAAAGELCSVGSTREDYLAVILGPEPLPPPAG